MTCPKCGTRLPAPAKGCPTCRTKAQRPVAEHRLQSKKPIKNGALYGAVGGAVFLAFAIIVGLKIAEVNEEGRRLAQRADQLAKSEEKFRTDAAKENSNKKSKPESRSTPTIPGKPESVLPSRTYRDPHLGFEIPIPEGWEAARRNSSGIVLQMTMGGSEESAFVLVTEPLPGGSLLLPTAWDEHLKRIVRDLQSKLGSEVSVVRREKGTCCRYPAFLATYVCRGQSLFILQYMVITPGRSYVLSWTTTESLSHELEPAFEKASKAFLVNSLNSGPSFSRPASALMPTEKHASPPAPLSPDPTVEKPTLFRHETMAFSIPVPAGWKSQAVPRASSFRTGVLSMEHPPTGGRGIVLVEKLPESLAKDNVDLEGWHKEHRGVSKGPVIRREKGSCSGCPSLLVHYESGDVCYLVATSDFLWEIEWNCMSQDRARLLPVFEKCSKDFSPPTNSSPPRARKEALLPSGLNANSDRMVYEDKAVGFSIPVPRGWKAEGSAREKIVSDVLLMTDVFFRTGRMIVRVEETPKSLKSGGQDWDAFLKETEKSAGERGGWKETKMEERTPASCSGHPAMKATWRYRVGEAPQTLAALYVATPDTLFRVEWISLPQDYRVSRALVDLCFDRFQVLGK